MAKKKKRRRRSGRGGIHSGKAKLEIFGAGAAFGYVEQTATGSDIMARIPRFDMVGPDGVKAILLHYIAKNFKGAIRKWADRGSVAYAGASGLSTGRSNFQQVGGKGHHGAGYMPEEQMVVGEVCYDAERDELSD